MCLHYGQTLFNVDSGVTNYFFAPQFVKKAFDILAMSATLLTLYKEIQEYKDEFGKSGISRFVRYLAKT